MCDAWIAIKDMGILPIAGSILLVIILIVALKGKGGGNSNDKSNS